MCCQGKKKICRNGCQPIKVDLDRTSGDFIYDIGSRDVLIAFQVNPIPGEQPPYIRCVPWDGRDGFGNKLENENIIVSKGLMSTAIINYVNSGGNLWNSYNTLSLVKYLVPTIPFNSVHASNNVGFDFEINMESIQTQANNFFMGFDSAEVKFEKSSINADFIKIEGIIDTNSKGLIYMNTDEDHYEASAALTNFIKMPDWFSHKRNYNIEASKYANL